MIKDNKYYYENDEKCPMMDNIIGDRYCKTMCNCESYDDNEKSIECKHLLYYYRLKKMTRINGEEQKNFFDDL